MRSPSGQAEYRVAPYCGKPTLCIDGVPTPHYLYCYPLSLDHPGAEEIHRRFAAHGCRFFTINVRGGVDGDWCTSPFWTDEDVFPDITDAAEVAANNLVRQAEMILRHAPDARFWVRYHCPPPLRFRQRNPDEMLLNSYGKRYEEPSLGSALFARQVRRFVENVVRFAERQPWGDRVVGYIVYPLGEGATVLTTEGFLFDRSPAMTRALRAYLDRQYGTDEALRSAWGDPKVTLATAEPPSDQAFAAAGLTRQADVRLDDSVLETPAPHRLHFPEPSVMRAAQDYCMCMRELTQQYLKALLEPVKEVAPRKLAAVDAFKQTMLGWPLVARWVGDYLTHSGSQHAVTGSFGVADMLDWPQLDAVATPHDYLHRGMGFGYEPEGIGDSIVLHGKLMLVEEDQRTFARNDRGRWNPLAEGREVEAGLWRNLGASISRGYCTYPMDIERPSFFMPDSVQDVLAARRRIHEAATRWDHGDPPGVVMIVDDWGTLCEDFSIHYQYLAILHQRLYGLSRCGVPYRIYLFDDLRRDDFPTYHRVFLFPNLFQVDAGRLDLIRRKLQGDGRVLVWGPATAMFAETGLDARNAEALTGFRLRLHRRESPRFVTVDRFDHPITAALPGRVDYGDSYVYGPILWPELTDGVCRLGGIQWPHAMDGAGLVVRSFGRGAAGSGEGAGERGEGDWASVFSAAVPLPDALLRGIARYAGAHVYHDTDDVLFADNRTITLHGVRPGPRCLRLPQRSDVWDLVTGERLGQALDEIRFELEAPQTRLFYLGGENPLEGGMEKP